MQEQDKPTATVKSHFKSIWLVTNVLTLILKCSYNLKYNASSPLVYIDMANKLFTVQGFTYI